MDNTTTKSFLEMFKGHHIFIAMNEYNGIPLHFHSGYDESEVTLRGRNVGDKMNGVFFTVNEMDETLDKGKHRTAKMVVNCRAVFMDDDVIHDKPRTDFPISPSIIVNSSPGKYHYYWLTSTDQFDEWKGVQNGIIQKYEGDNNAKDLSRYLRLPGFYHNKDQLNPHMVTWEGNGGAYEWSEIVEAFPVAEKKAGAKKVTQGTSAKSKSVSDYEKDIITGKDYHGSILSLGYQMKQEGVPERYITLALQGIMNQCSDDLKAEDRWKSRYDEIERSVVEATEKESVDLDKISIYEEDIKERPPIPWPPGMMGELCDAAFNQQMFQYKEVAVVSAIGLVAGIAGRRFNVNRTGLNVYLTLIMSTGMGKDSISEFIHGTLTSLNDIGNATSFIGHSRFTGPKSIIQSMENARSKICVFSEAGLLLKSKAGDKDGLSRMLLNLYGKSGHNSISGSEGFSKEEDGLKSLRSPSLSIINEATPETLLEAFKDGQALERGELPRQSIYRIVGDKPYINEDAADYKMPDELRLRLKGLISQCSKVQSVEDSKAWIMKPASDKIKQDMKETSHKYTDIENKHRGEDSIRSIMASRAYLKTLKFAALASVFNHKDVVIREDEWHWAKEMVEYEMNGLDNFFAGGNFGDVYSDNARRIVGNAIVKVLRQEYKNKKQQVNRQDAKRGVFPLSVLAQVLKNNKELQALSDDVRTRSRPITGLEKVIDYMVRMGQLMTVPDDKRKNVYKITESFRLTMEG